MKKIVVSAIGKDRPGIVGSLTEALYLAGCNLEDSAMTILEGEFAVLLIATLPSRTSIAVLHADLRKRAKKLGLVLNVKEMPIARGKASQLSQSAIVTVSGKDQTGIIYRIASALAKRKVNIVDLSSRQIPGRDNSLLYVVMMEVAVPTKLSLEILRKDLQEVGSSMQLDLNVREISIEQL